MRHKKLFVSIHLVVLLTLLVLPMRSYAQEQPCEGIPENPSEYVLLSGDQRFSLFSSFAGYGCDEPLSIELVIANIVRVVLGFVGIVLIILIIYGGIMWMTSAGNEEKIAKAKKTILNATIGVTIVFVAYAIAWSVTLWLAQAVSQG